MFILIKMTTRHRGWCFTLNNYANDDVERIMKIEHRYVVIGYEVGEQGTPHLQGYIEFKNPRAFGGVNKLGLGHIEARRGTPEEAEKYCKKDGNWVEDGEPLAQGDRNDIKKTMSALLEGTYTVEELIVEQPTVYQLYGRTFERALDLQRRTIYRTEMTVGVWLWGPTGVGKSHRAFEGYDPETHYVWSNDNGWWDGYVGQETVIINDFRGEITFGMMLNLVDKWPFMVRRRNREPFPFLAKKVIVTSSLQPHQVYKNLDEDKLDQLYRRFLVEEICSTEVLQG